MQQLSDDVIGVKEESTCDSCGRSPNNNHKNALIRRCNSVVSTKQPNYNTRNLPEHSRVYFLRRRTLLEPSLYRYPVFTGRVGSYGFLLIVLP